MSIFKGNLNSANMFTANDDIRGLRLIAPASLPSFIGLECADGTDWYLWINDDDNLVMHTAAPTSTYDSVGTVVTGATVSGANAALSNLSAQTLVSQDLDPGTNATYDLGDSTHVWAEAFITKMVLYPTNCYFTGTSAVATLTGALVTGADGEGYDVTFYGETALQYMQWDENAYSDAGALLLKDNVRLGLGSASAATGDAYMYGDGTNLVIEGAVDDTIVKSGGSTHLDWIWYNKSSTNDMSWTADSSILQLSGTAILHFGGAAALDGGTAGVILAWDDTDTLNIDAATAENIVRIGETTSTDFYLDGAGAVDIHWDASAAEYLFNDDAKLVFGGTSDHAVLYSDGTLLQVELGGGATCGINVVGYADQTTSMLVLDGLTNNWDGAAGVGMLHIKNDVAFVDADASMLRIASSGAPYTAAVGFMANFDDIGTATASTYGVNVYSLNNNPLRVATGAVGVIPITVLPVASATAPALQLGAAATAWVGAANTGYLNIASSGTLAQTTASLLRLDFNGTYKANGEGGCLFIDDDGVASSTNYSVYVNSNAVNCMKLETGNTGMIPLTIEPKTSSVVAGIKVDGKTNGWLGVAGTGLLHVCSSGTLAATNTGCVYVDFDGTYAANGVGGCLYIDDDGVASSTNYSVYVNSNAVHCMKLETANVAFTPLTLTPKAAATAAGLLVGSGTSTYVGADDTGLVHIQNASSGAHVGSTLLLVETSGARIASAEGFMARFTDIGAAATSAYGVGMYSLANDVLRVRTGATGKIPITIAQASSATVPSLKIGSCSVKWLGAANIGMVDISSTGTLANAAASLVHIDFNGTYASAGEGGCLFIDDDGTASGTNAAVYINSSCSVALKLETQAVAKNAMVIKAASSQTASTLVIDGSTTGAAYSGANDVGMVHIKGSTGLAHAGATLLYVGNTGQPITAAEGCVARFLDTGTARSGTYAVEINSTNNNPLHVKTGAVGVTPITVHPFSSGTVAAISIASTGSWKGAAGVGMFTVSSTGTLANAAASLAVLDFNGTYATDGAGACLYVDDDGAAGSGDNYAVYINSLAACPLKLETQAVAENTLYVATKASQTAAAVVVGTTNSTWIGADDIGMLHLKNSSSGANVGATMFLVESTGVRRDSAEGFLARFVDAGTSNTTAYAVEIQTTVGTPCFYMNGQMTISAADAAGTLFDITAIDTTGNSDTMTINHSGSGCALKITSTDADSIGVELVPATTGTVSSLMVGAAGSLWNGANDVGLVQIQNSSALASTGASLLIIKSSGQPKAGAEGFLARFIDVGTAQTTAYAVGIETTNTTPCLKCNNEVVISGATGAGTLLTITSTDVGTNPDTINVTHVGSGCGMKITSGETDSIGQELVTCAAQTVPSLMVGTVATTWAGANDIGMVHIQNASSHAHAGAALLIVESSGARQASAEGFLARFIDTGTASTGAYAIEIATTTLTGGLHSDAHCTFDRGIQCGAVAIAANSTGIACPEGVSHFTVTSANANNWVILPTPTPGHEVWFYAAAQFEIRASSSSVAINGGKGATAESQVNVNELVRCVCTTSTTWIATMFNSTGTEAKLTSAA